MRFRILFLALVLSLSHTPAYANPKPAAKCSNACTPALGPSGGFIYRYVKGVQQRKGINNRWQKSDSRKESLFDPIRTAAYKSINSLAIDSNHQNIEFEDLIRPSFPKPIAEIVRLQAKEAAKRISPLLDSRIKVKLIGITEKDQLFVDNELPTIVPRTAYGESLEILTDYVSLERFYNRGGTGGGFAGYSEEKGYGFYAAHTSSLATLDSYWPEVPPHEMAHVLQNYLIRNNGNMYGEGDPRSKVNGHLMEGSANTLGMAFAFKNIGWYNDEMDRLLARDIQSTRGAIPMKNINDAVAFIKDIEKRDTERRNQFVYSAGQFIWEYYIGAYGVDKFIELLKNMKSTENFNENLKATIGKDREAFYQEAGAYLLKNWQRLS